MSSQGELTLSTGAIIGLTLAILTSALLITIFNNQLTFWLDTETEDTDTLNSFKLLRDTTAQLLTTQEACASTLTIFNLGEDYALLGFDKGEKNYLIDDCGAQRYKPPACGNKACICLYNTHTWNPHPGVHPEQLAQGLIQSGTFDGCLPLPENVNSVNSVYGLSHHTANYGGKKTSTVSSSTFPYAYLFTAGTSKNSCGEAFEGTTQAQNLYIQYNRAPYPGDASLFLTFYFEDPRLTNHINACQQPGNPT